MSHRYDQYDDRVMLHIFIATFLRRFRLISHEVWDSYLDEAVI